MTTTKPKKNANRYVPISIDEMMTFMKSNLFVVEERDNTQGRHELIFTFSWNDDNYLCKVYSSVVPQQGESRPVGDDAIRVVLLVNNNGRFVPVWKAPRVYRTKNWRIKLQQRIDESLLRGKEGEDYECPLCNSPVVMRDGRNGKFWACSSWSKTRCEFTADYRDQ